MNKPKGRRAIFINMAATVVLRVFFRREYLSGRWFDGSSYSGIKWALKAIWQRNILRIAKPAPWPIGLTTYISSFNNVVFHIDDLNNFQSPGVYMQNFGGLIFIGRGTYIGPNVGIITANHDIRNLDVHLSAKNVVIGDRCWLGMNSVILPGVTLLPQTIVAAGSIVTKSFDEGKIVVAGNPAKIVKRL
ncbi:DapH/DapD/GlmU-related protein [Mesorhizobium sp. ES1-1]|uniref:DapH/DapD/GlmU-related protein n=1 Tax=Mesorhizobium sp. ES1-1 TaxID=2876629 RepID=UPI001CCC4AD7|nr:DapH/DapD/GlmU-related protein [Mesorhizobium sp. ES1-1]MBZ9674725.1 hypothetical protein [Mesorhizobium sp. ES1-1]